MKGDVIIDPSTATIAGVRLVGNYMRSEKPRGV
jgi:hypothetical protein